MARPPRKKAQRGFYHVMIRGNGRMVVFTDNEDRHYFLSCLEEALKRAEIKLIAWCLMDNHCHLLLSDEHDNLSEAMHNVATRYALHFNKNTGHIESVFQGGSPARRLNQTTISFERFAISITILAKPASRANSTFGAAITNTRGVPAS